MLSIFGANIIYSSFINGNAYNVKIHLLSDGSGYYITGYETPANKANLWKYLYSSPSTSQWQQITNFSQYAFGQLKLSDTSIFMLGIDSSFPTSLHMYKLTFGNTSPAWALTMACPIGIWSTSYSESVLISSTIFSFFVYGTIPQLYLAMISESDGSVSTRFKSSISCSWVYGSGVNGDFIVASALCSPSYYLIVINKVTNNLNIRSFSGNILYGIGIEISTGR